MRVFSGPDNRRAVPDEILEKLKTVTESEPVQGFASMLDPGSARNNEDRISGFSEVADRREWILSLDAGKGMKFQTGAVPKNGADSVVFMLSIGFGNGSPLPQPTGSWIVRINGREAIRIRGVNHSQLWKNNECALAFAANRIETANPFESLRLSSIVADESVAAFGPALLKVPAKWLEQGKTAAITFEPCCDVASSRWIQVSACPNIVRTTDIWMVADILTGSDRKESGGYKLFFGDIHTHSGQVLDAVDGRGCGMGSRSENYEYAKGPGGIDFYALTDHEYQIDPDNPGSYLDLADTYNQDGRFVCLPAFEYTNLLYGHRNVYFRDTGGAVFNTNRDQGRPTLDPSLCNTPADLWKAMEKTGVPFITAPHHPSAASHPLNLDFHNPKYDRLYEIYSSWGSSEYYGDFPRGVSDRLESQDFQDAMRRGLRYGVIASADGHDGHPGNAQSPLVKHHHLFHFCGSGRAAVLAPELTRPAVFDALYERRCYATTGTPIAMNVNVNGAAMGSEIPPLKSGEVPQVRIDCEGTNGLDHIRIVRNGSIIETIPCHGRRKVNIEWEDTSYKTGNPSSYYARIVQVDRESAWSSPVWLG